MFNIPNKNQRGQFFNYNGQANKQVEIKDTRSKFEKEVEKWCKEADQNNFSNLQQYVDQNYKSNQQQQPSENKKTALMHACTYSSVKAVEFLLPFEKCCTDDEQKCALMYAAQSNSISCINALKEFELKMADKNGFTSLMHACKCNSYDSIEYLLDECGMQNSEGQYAIDVACACGFEKIVEILLDKEGEIKDKDGRNALMRFIYLQGQRIQKDFHAICKPVIDVLANKLAGQIDNNGYTALMLACLSGFTKCAVPLLEKEIQICTEDGTTVLMLLIKSGQGSLLAQSDTSIQYTSTLKCGATCTHYGCVFDKFKQLVGKQNNKGQTALMILAENLINERCRFSNNNGVANKLFEIEAQIVDSDGNCATDYLFRSLAKKKSEKLVDAMDMTSEMTEFNTQFTEIVTQFILYEKWVMHIDDAVIKVLGVVDPQFARLLSDRLNDTQIRTLVTQFMQQRYYWRSKKESLKELGLLNQKYLEICKDIPDKFEAQDDFGNIKVFGNQEAGEEDEVYDVDDE